MRRGVPLLAAVAGLAAIGYAVLAKPTDEELILDRLAALEAAIQVDGDTSPNPVLRAGAVQGAFKEIFVEDVTFSIPELTSGGHGRAALAGLAARSGLVYRTLTVDFGGTDVTVARNASTATVQTTATVQATRGAGLERERRPVAFGFTRVDGDWRIASVRVEPEP
jgi:hypothetical protein